MIDRHPEFTRLLDAEQVATLLQAELPDCKSGNWQITRCSIQHPRYKTYLNPASRHKAFLAVAYHLEGINLKTKRFDNRIVYVKAYLGKRSFTEYEQACAALAKADQSALLHLADYGMVLWCFPYDSQLPSLPKLLDENAMQGYFSEGLLADKPDTVAIKIINYRPEIRCTCRYDITFATGQNSTLYGKNFADNNGAEIYQRQLTLSQSNQASFTNKHLSSGFTIAKPLSYDADIHTIWLEGLAGSPLLAMLNGDNAKPILKQIAKNIAAFHTGYLPNLPALTELDLLAEIKKKAAKLCLAYPNNADHLQRIIQHLDEQFATLPVVPDGLLHADFHIQQLSQCEDGSIALFDFDELAIGNPLVDVANFVADLYRHQLGVEFTHNLARAFFADYQHFSQTSLNVSHFVWHLQIQLITRAYRAYLQQKPDQHDVMSQMLQIAQDITGWK
jgi:Phosphotransferase enzyme family